MSLTQGLGFLHVKRYFVSYGIAKANRRICYAVVIKEIDGGLNSAVFCTITT